MRSSITFVILFLSFSAFAQECPCTIPVKYEPNEFRIGKTDAITSNPYENFKIIDPQYFDYKGRAHETCVRLTFSQGTILVKKGQKKPKAYIDGVVMDDIRLKGTLCMYGIKYIVIGRYQGEGNWVGAVFSHTGKPPLYEINWSIDNDNRIDVNIQDDGEGGLTNLKLIKFKAKNYSNGNEKKESREFHGTESENISRVTTNASTDLLSNNNNLNTNDGSFISNGFYRIPETGGKISSGYVVEDYLLGNRLAISKPVPKKNCNESGIVIVEVVVDRNGKTIEARTGIKGTTNMASCLLDEARIAAMNTRWDTRSSAPEKQIGKIIYNFKVN
jgi:hypothetical protein